MAGLNGSDLFIVDDDPSVRDALSVVFTVEGYHVTRFADGESFLAAARTETPSCVLLDVHMPGRSGIDVLRQLDAQRYGAPIFVISAQGDIPLAVEAIKHGAFDFIEKPFDAETVVTRVRTAIAIFGIDRCMFASNFPVAGLRVDYDTLVSAVSRMLDDFSDRARQRFFIGNAAAFYRLDGISAP